MPKNTYYIKNEVEKPNEVYELKKDEYQFLSFEEFMKSYEVDEKVNYDDLGEDSIGEVKGYEPCRNTLCSCSCSSSECVCARAEVSAKKEGGDTSIGSITSYGRRGWDDSFEGEVRASAIRVDDIEKDVRVGSVMVGGRITRSNVSVKAGRCSKL